MDNNKNLSKKTTFNPLRGFEKRPEGKLKMTEKTTRTKAEIPRSYCKLNTRNSKPKSSFADPDPETDPNFFLNL